jgi:hypothetical protein
MKVKINDGNSITDQMICHCQLQEAAVLSVPPPPKKQKKKQTRTFNVNFRRIFNYFAFNCSSFLFPHVLRLTKKKVKEVVYVKHIQVTA